MRNLLNERRLQKCGKDFAELPTLKVLGQEEYSVENDEKVQTEQNEKTSMQSEILEGVHTLDIGDCSRLNAKQ